MTPPGRRSLRPEFSSALLGILGAVLGLVTGSEAWIAGVAGVGSGAALLAGAALALGSWRDVSAA
ncbi:hypothetical protein [Pseudonocardia sp.]|jgi:hypothetical protein|uniref:hypothetical protein n=1 Tax=Pseudonocardia sp. TaxID=60912 RepID=UPI003D0E1DD0